MFWITDFKKDYQKV